MCALGTCLAQKHDYNWVMGYDSHLGFPDKEGVFINFNEIPFLPEYKPIQLFIRQSNASISDSNGTLLFYTNGCAISNDSNVIIQNGAGLNPGAVSDAQCDWGYTAGAQSCLALPFPNVDSFFILLHKSIIYIYEPEFRVLTDKLYCTTINTNSPIKAIEKNTILVSDTLDAGQLTAVKHANGIDWWIITPEYLTKSYYILSLTSSGIEIVAQQQIGNSTSIQSQGSGQAVFSPDGAKYIRYNPNDGVFVFDFDRVSGELSNFEHIPVNDGAFAGGVAVSPNSRYLYVSSELHIYQFDLWAEDVAASRITVAVFDGYASPFQTTFFQAQLAPDCKIYINTFATVDVLHVIHNPDEPGLACNVEQHAIQLPFNHGQSLPHFPNYRLGPLVPGETPAPPCELVVHTEEPPAEAEAQFLVYPNPASGQLTLAPAAPAVGSWQLFHADGRLALQQRLDGRSHEYRVAIGHLPPGMYFYRLLVDGQPGLGGKVSIIR